MFIPYTTDTLLIEARYSPKHLLVSCVLSQI